MSAGIARRSILAASLACAALGVGQACATPALAAGAAPVVGEALASAVTQTGATILDTVDPRGLPTSYEFDIGEAETVAGVVRYDYSHLKIFGQAGPGNETIEVRLQGLAPGTTYHYRIVATNKDGSSPEDVEQEFTTLGVPSPIVQPVAPPQLAIPPIAFPVEEPAAPAVVKPKPKPKPKHHKAKSHKKHKQAKHGRK